jgi:hypothetical protein
MYLAAVMLTPGMPLYYHDAGQQYKHILLWAQLIGTLHEACYYASHAARPSCLWSTSLRALCRSSSYAPGMLWPADCLCAQKGLTLLKVLTGRSPIAQCLFATA